MLTVKCTQSYQDEKMHFNPQTADSKELKKLQLQHFPPTSISQWRRPQFKSWEKFTRGYRRAELAGDNFH
jgi:hypothetical protein